MAVDIALHCMLNLNFMYQTTKEKKITAILGTGPISSRKKSYQKTKNIG